MLPTELSGAGTQPAFPGTSCGSCLWPQGPSAPAPLRKAPSAQHLQRAAWQPATVPALKTGVSSPWGAPRQRFLHPFTLCAIILHSQGRENLHNVIMVLIFEMQGGQGTAHLVFITVYKQWQNNLQIRETDLIRHIRVQTHSLAGQTEGSVPAFSKCLPIQGGSLHRETKTSVRS